MAVVDIIIGCVLVYGFIRGVWKGFFSELASLLSILLGIYAAIMLSGYMIQVINRYLHWEGKPIRIIAFILTFILAVIAVILLGKLFTKLASFAMMGWLNKLLGGVFGFLKWLIIVSLLAHIFSRINHKETLADKNDLNESYCYNPLLKVYGTISPLFSKWADSFWKENTETEEPEIPEQEQDDNPIEGLDRSV
ncbi:CvpA family protein [Flavobacterium salilacus subsp. salilacus]|uniref:CvpA family protein n=1 Tax=Flavobacterium TaxID=237 RepID=UPI001075331C|nr:MULTISPECIES: CvpA family protein [Flavobacterium]KAF2515096.1 CvpA family protein [Flavobacterium salilacus subsp. salilacus]MBE1615889.1 CvpA family protein [Flavobacterium sp. SaA2.13]